MANHHENGRRVLRAMNLAGRPGAGRFALSGGYGIMEIYEEALADPAKFRLHTRQAWEGETWFLARGTPGTNGVKNKTTALRHHADLVNVHVSFCPCRVVKPGLYGRH